MMRSGYGGRRSQWGREFRALCDVKNAFKGTMDATKSQWGREFRALCDENLMHLYGIVYEGVSMGPRIPRAL